MQRDTPKVFISYSHHDSEWARQFAEQLNKLGLNVWFDQFNVGLGQAWAQAIEKGLRESNVIVSLMRAEDLEHTNLFNANLYLELGAALSLGKTIIPVIPEGIDLAKLPSPLRLRRGLIRATPEATAQEFVRELEAVPREAA
jgi:hypothetical protein